MKQINAKQGNTIVIVVVAVVVVGIIGYFIYNNNQKQAAADAQVAAAQQQTIQAQQEAKRAQIQQEAQQRAINAVVDSAKTEIVAGQEAAQQQADVDAVATCQENLTSATANLPKLKDYSKMLEDLGEAIDDNPDTAIAKCRELHEGLSKNECDTKVEAYVAGKTEVYDELQEEIKTTEETIAAGC